MLPLMEVFSSIQGEGRYAGKPSIFVRFGGCNFSCAGFGVEYEDPNTGEKKLGCDSYYSVDRAFKGEWDIITDYNQIVDKVEEVMPRYPRGTLTKPDIVVTGGEPLLYWKDKEFQMFMAFYISRGHQITIETNSSLDIEFTRNYQREITFSMSTKLSVSGEKEHKRINIENITNILEEAPTSYLKFVVANGDQLAPAEAEIDAILQEIPIYADVYLMPLGDVIDVLESNAKSVMELAIKKGFNYSDRLHIRIWDNEAGV